MRDKQSLLRKFKTNIEENKLFSPGNHIVAGISGGADSVCLLTALTALRNDYNLSITAVHVNHMLRGSESDEDEAFTVELCKRLGVDLRIFHEDIGEISARNRVSKEEAGREARYSLFLKVLREAGADAVAVAHNFEDQAETVMMNILRGCGTEGLAGMDYKTGFIIRPLLNVRRREILDYLEAMGQPYRTDSTNASDDYTRNRIRNMLFPYMREHFPADPAEMLNRLAVLVRRDDDYLAGVASDVFSKAGHTQNGLVTINTSLLKELDAAILSRVARLAWEKITGSKKRLEAVHIEGILDLIRGNGTGKSLSLPNNLAAWRSYGNVLMGGKPEPLTESYAYRVAVPGLTTVPEAGGTLAARILDKKGVSEVLDTAGGLKENAEIQIFDYLKINCGINIRNRRDGDRIHPKGGPGEKKLKAFFIDRKIPAGERDSIPLVASGQDVIWIVGMRTSERYAPDSRTESYLVLSWDRNERQMIESMGERK